MSSRWLQRCVHASRLGSLFLAYMFLCSPYRNTCLLDVGAGGPLLPPAGLAPKCHGYDTHWYEIGTKRFRIEHANSTGYETY